MKSAIGSAPGRLDFMGGVADYSGSLVLQTPIEAHTRVEISELDEAVLRVSSAGQALFELPLAQMERVATDAVPVWARYILGCLWLFGREWGWQSARGLRFDVSSDVPLGMGVSSSAALEVATMRALETLSGHQFEGTALSRLAQRVDNDVVGAPCGLMDQLASAHGRAGALLPILCRPDITSEPIALPDELIVAGWPSGVKHAVADAPYATARAAAFMGKKMLEAHFGRDLKFLTELAPSQVRALSDEVLSPHITGAAFTSRFGGVDDALTKIESHRVYPLRAGTLFPVEENARCQIAAALLRAGDKTNWPTVGELMFQGNAGYGTLNLNCPETDAMVETIRDLGADNGFYGARVSGGGSGGTVVVLLERAALDKLRECAVGRALIV